MKLNEVLNESVFKPHKLADFKVGDVVYLHGKLLGEVASLSKRKVDKYKVHVMPAAVVVKMKSGSKVVEPHLLGLTAEESKLAAKEAMNK